MAVLGGGIPDQFLALMLRLLASQLQQGCEFFFSEACANFFALPSIDQSILSDSWNTNLSQECQSFPQAILIVSEHGGVGHHE